MVGDLECGDFAVTMLRELHSEPTESPSYSELYALYLSNNDSRVWQFVGDFADDGLGEKFGPQTDQKVELLPAGERIIELFEQETAR